MKRATYVVNYHVAAVSYFNPRPREEGDVLFSNTLCCIILFQSTPS